MKKTRHAEENRWWWSSIKPCELLPTMFIIHIKYSSESAQVMQIDHFPKPSLWTISSRATTIDDIIIYVGYKVMDTTLATELDMAKFDACFLQKNLQCCWRRWGFLNSQTRFGEWFQVSFPWKSEKPHENIEVHFWLETYVARTTAVERQRL